MSYSHSQESCVLGSSAHQRPSRNSYTTQVQDNNSNSTRLISFRRAINPCFYTTHTWSLSRHDLNIFLTKHVFKVLVGQISALAENYSLN